MDDHRPSAGQRAEPHLRDIRAVHFDSLWLVPILLGRAWAFERLGVPDSHQAAFPAGLGLLILFTRPAGLDPFYYWTRGWALVLSLIGLACLVTVTGWTAVVQVVYALA